MYDHHETIMVDILYVLLKLKEFYLGSLKFYCWLVNSKKGFLLKPKSN